MSEKAELTFDPKDFLPSLQATITTAGLNGTKLTVALPCDKGGKLLVQDRHTIKLYDGVKYAEWTVASLRELFRGNKTPPSLERYPPEYVPVFFFVEKHVLTACSAADLRDQELEEIYSLLRRRPDGKSLGPIHDFLWQVAALILALRPLSQAEFEEVFGQLARSCRHWQMGPTSRNYATYLQQNIGARR